jgi:hypothetical protein
MDRPPPLSLVRRLLAGAVLVLVLVGTERFSPAAPGVAAAEQDIESSDDFRVRVGAALVLGKAKPPGARAKLERALGDPHPAVRTAAAAALAALGDVAAIPALERRVAGESSPSAKAQMTASIDALRRAAQGPWPGARYVVQVGVMRNRTAVRGDQASDVLRTATAMRARAIPGAVVTDGHDQALLDQASLRHVPILELDGALQRLVTVQRSTQVTFDAEVEYSVRRVPQQMLRGTFSGAASSVGSLTALGDPSLVTLLQNQAIDGAVESALRGAERGLSQALQ